MGNWLFRHREWIFPVCMVALLVLFPPPEEPPWGSMPGWLVAGAGQFIRFLTVGFAYIKRGGKDGKVHADSLRTVGMFSLCRNPLYLGNLLILVGLFLIYASPIALIIGTILGVTFYGLLVGAEEAFLLDKFGEVFEDYCRRVNRWVPDPRRLPGAFDDLRFVWQRIVIREYSSAGLWVAIGLVLMIWKHGGVTSGLWVGLLGLDVLVYVTARYLKKKKILTVSGPVVRRSDATK